MALTYFPIDNRSAYEAPFRSNAAMMADFATVWSAVSGVDLKYYYDEYNRLEGTANLAGFTALGSDISTSISSMNATKTRMAAKYSGKDLDNILAPVNDTLSKLGIVQREVSRNIKAYSPSTSKFGLIRAIHAAKARVTTIKDAINKFRAPGEKIYDKTVDFLKKGK